MTKLACIFPGQGTQKVGMCSELYANSPVAKRVFDEVDDALSSKLSKIIFEGPAEDLMRTENTQPALMTCSIALLRVLEAESGKSLKEFCSVVAGHSLGEFTALVAAEALTLSECAVLLRARGQAMQEAGAATPGAMFALLGASFDVASEIAQEAGVEVANDNAQSQQVLSGPAEAIDKAVGLAGARGFKAIRLPVSGAFHSKLMQSARAKLEAALAEVNLREPAITLIANVSGAVMSDASPQAVREALLAQLTSTVQWCKSMQALRPLGVECVAEVGPGNVYTNLLKRIDAEMPTASLNGIEAIAEFVKKIGS